MVENASAPVIAVVDDDEAILRSIQFLLESADLTVRTFTSGVALLHSGTLAEIDCLVSDIDMPGIDGFELLRRVHAERPNLPAILITGYPDTLRELPPANGGRLRYFTKPFKGPEFLRAITDALAESRRR